MVKTRRIGERKQKAALVLLSAALWRKHVLWQRRAYYTLQSLRSGLKTGGKCFIQGIFFWVPAGVLLHVVVFLRAPVTHPQEFQAANLFSLNEGVVSVCLTVYQSVCLSVGFLSSSSQSILETRFSFLMRQISDRRVNMDTLLKAVFTDPLLD